MHIRSNHDLNEERLLKLLSDSAPKNVQLLFEHESSDNFEAFIKKFKHLQQKGIGFTFDTAHIFGAGIRPEDIKSVAGGTMPTLIHLNGSQCTLNSHRDVHVPICSEFDNVFNKNTLKKFLQDYRQTPIIIEARNDPDYYDSRQLVKNIENVDDMGMV